ncbi:dehydrin Rab18-like [Punica granatum]|uniref:Uncharacterized protein n=2 Tax=Punica granatum TaxID=22663 RepID=A0A218XUT9_PUNGR|nr:dehydrin Rab18-like [Punica granatum]OWM88807.1 hypothetical protein CDL15_Pgr020761 [Punica granatum]PKI72158.1 hypothetical protein CRG98_007427 [Punica granatum]
MEQRQGRYDPTRQTDEYGNPVQQGGTTGMHGTGMGGTGMGGTGYGGTGMGGAGGEAEAYGLGSGGQGQQQQRRQHQEDQGGVLQRSGSGSSSSEDDGQGGRRKKGLKDKLMDKIPGVGGKDTDQQRQQTGATGGYAEQQYQAGQQHGHGQQYQAGQQQQEKKGMMGKIKDTFTSSH